MTPFLRKRGSPWQTTRARRIEVVARVLDELDDGLAQLHDLDLTWSLHWNAVLEERT